MRIILIKCCKETSDFYDQILFQLLDIPITTIWYNQAGACKRFVEDFASQRNLSAHVYTSKDLHNPQFFWKESIKEHDVVVIVYEKHDEAVCLYEMFGQKNHSKENSTFSGKIVFIHNFNGKFEKAELIL